MLDRADFIRYSRQILLPEIGEEGQEALQAAHVVIVGMGGLGCPAAQYLAASGIGEITLIDPDLVDKSNLPRQILYRLEDAGSAKVLAAKAQLEGLNPRLRITPLQESVSATQLTACLDTNPCALVLDCTDNLSARQLINQVCHTQRVPLVSASGVGWSCQIMAFPFATPDQGCLACVFPPSEGEPVHTCATSGVMGPVLGVAASMQAMIAIKLLSGVSPKLTEHNRLSRYDAKSNRWDEFALPSRADCPVCASFHQESSSP